MRELFRDAIENARQRVKEGAFYVRRKLEKPLTQIEIGEAYQVERKVRREADMLLDNLDEVSRTDPNGRKLVIKGKKQLEIEETSFTGADLLISISERNNVGYSFYIWSKYYAFYRDHVGMHIAKTVSRRGKTPEEYVIITEADAKDLNTLLNALRDSKPAPQEAGKS